MKLMYCELCGDIVAPYPVARITRACLCGRHVVWWEDPEQGIIRVCYKLGTIEEIRAEHGRPVGAAKVWLLGITNLLLNHTDALPITADVVQQIIDLHSEHYLFKKWRSLVVRIRPGETSDSAWASLPEGQ